MEYDEKKSRIALLTILRDRGATAESIRRLAGISGTTKDRIFGRNPTLVTDVMLAKVAKALGIDFNTLKDLHNEHVREAELLKQSPADLIPTYPWPVACGEWYHHGEDALGILTPQQRSAGVNRFRVKLMGDSMAPDWPDGSLVEFTPCDPFCPTVHGKDYLFFRSDHSCTLKRLDHTDNEFGYYLRAINPKYKKLMPLPWQESVAISIPLGIIPPSKTKPQSHP